MSKKLTQKEILELMLKEDVIANSPTYREYCEKALERLEKKSAGAKKPTATQLANIALKEDIVGTMEKNRLYTITELIKEIPCCADLTNQKVSALMKQLIDVGAVVKTVDKGKSLFSLA